MTVFKVQGMSCQHCVAAVTKSIQQVTPAASVTVDLARGEVKVEPAPDLRAISDAVKQAGYEVTGVA